MRPKLALWFPELNSVQLDKLEKLIAEEVIRARLNKPWRAPYLYRLSGEIHEGVETSEWMPTDIDRGNEYPWETKKNEEKL